MKLSQIFEQNVQNNPIVASGKFIVWTNTGDMDGLQSADKIVAGAKRVTNLADSCLKVKDEITKLVTAMDSSMSEQDVVFYIKNLNLPYHYDIYDVSSLSANDIDQLNDEFDNIKDETDSWSSRRYNLNNITAKNIASMLTGDD